MFLMLCVKSNKRNNRSPFLVGWAIRCCSFSSYKSVNNFQKKNVTVLKTITLAVQIFNRIIKALPNRESIYKYVSHSINVKKSISLIIAPMFKKESILSIIILH